MLLNIWQRCKNVRLKLFVMLVLILLDAFLATFSITMIMPITNAALGGAQELSWITEYIPEPYRANTPFLIMCLGIILFAKFIISVMRLMFSLYVTERMREDWQVRLNRQYILRPFKETLVDRRGGLINNLMKETDAASGFILNYLGYITQLILMLALLSLLVSVNWQWLVGGGFLVALAWFFIVRPYFALGSRLGKKNIALNQILNSVMYESLSGIKDIKISNSEEFQIGKVRDLAADVRRNRTLSKISQGVPSLGNDIVLAGVMLFVAFTIPSDLNEIKSIMPQIALFIVGVAKLSSIASTLASRRFKVMAKYPSFLLVTGELEGKDVKAEALDGGRGLSGFDGDLCLRGIEFAYDSETPVLKGLDMNVERGKTICVLGASGSGKTTLIDILARLYTPERGSIVVDGAADNNATEYKLSDWRRMIGYVPQEPVIYYGSLRENITLGRDDITDADIENACQLSCAAEFIEKLPDGYDTILRESGSNLSGGQKKRLAIARALAQKSELIILDEATGAIQEEAEKELIENLRQASGLTIIIISHRSSTQDLADICYKIEGGRAHRIKG